MKRRQKMLGWVYRIAAFLSSFFLATGIGYSQDTIPGGDRSPSIYQPATSTQWNSQQSGFVCLELANTHGPSSVGGPIFLSLVIAAGKEA